VKNKYYFFTYNGIEGIEEIDWIEEIDDFQCLGFQSFKVSEFQGFTLPLTFALCTLTCI